MNYSNSKIPKVTIVSSDKEYLSVLSCYINDYLNIEVIGTSNNIFYFYEKKNIFCSDVILIDYQFPKNNGISVAKLILNDCHYAKMISLIPKADEVCLLDLIHQGFRGCVLKNRVYNELEQALKFVTNNHYYYPNYIQLKKLI